MELTEVFGFKWIQNQKLEAKIKTYQITYEEVKRFS